MKAKFTKHFCWFEKCPHWKDGVVIMNNVTNRSDCTTLPTTRSTIYDSQRWKDWLWDMDIAGFHRSFMFVCSTVNTGYKIILSNEDLIVLESDDQQH